MQDIEKEWIELFNFFCSSNTECQNQLRKFRTTITYGEYIYLCTCLQKIEQPEFNPTFNPFDVTLQQKTEHLHQFRSALVKVIIFNENYISLSPEYRELVEDFIIEKQKIALHKVEFLLKSIAVYKLKNNHSKTNILFFLNPHP